MGLLRSATIAVLAVCFGAGCEGRRGTNEGATVARSSSHARTVESAPVDLTMGHPAFSAPPPAMSAPPLVRTSVDLPKEPAVDVRMPTDWLADLSWNGNERLAHAKRERSAVVQQLFEKAGATFPPHDVLYRVFKKERQFEVWAAGRGEPMKLIATYGICAASGELGPKRREGDMQVPEGFYKVGYFHPMSSYYLSAQVDYPNRSDKIRGGASPGGDILIHGRCASIGCISMTDERIEEIYLVGWAAFMNGGPTAIHIFPSRDMDALLEDPKYDEHHAFWREIKPGLDAFDASHRLPSIRIESDGRYVVTPSGV